MDHQKEKLNVNPKDCNDIGEAIRPLVPEGVKDAGLESLFDGLSQGVRS
jgi:hypothetical protein